MRDAGMHLNRIGASQAAAVLKMDDLTSEFEAWERIQGFDGGDAARQPSLRMLIGKACEPLILDEYARKTGTEPEYCDVTEIHPRHEWLVATPDAKVPGLRKLVELKMVWWDQRRKWGLTADDIPDRIPIQAWAQMAVTGYEACDIAALIGEDLRVYTVRRDPECEAILLQRLEAWHRRHIVEGQRPAYGPSDAAGDWLQKTFPRHKRPDLRQATDEEIALLREYTITRLSQEKLTALKKAFENEIKGAIGDREGLVWPEGKFTWRKCKDSQEVNWEAIARGFMTKYMPTLDDQQAHIALHTNTVPGSRRMRFEHDALKAEREEAA